MNNNFLMGPAMANPRFDKLHRSLKTATDLLDTWHLFGDLIQDPAFMRDGVPFDDTAMKAAQDGRIGRALEAVCKQATRKPGQVSDSATVHLPDAGLWHGKFVFASLIGFWFFFEDLDQGLIGLKENAMSEEVRLVRFSVIPLPATAMLRPKERGEA